MTESNPQWNSSKCSKHDCYYISEKGCPLCEKENDMTKYPDPEQEAGKMALMRACVADLQTCLEQVKLTVKVLIHDRNALQRERNTVLQALANQVCIEGGPLSIRMDPKEGLQGYCPHCTVWHSYTEWAEWGEEEHG